jgi:putative transposase
LHTKQDSNLISILEVIFASVLRGEQLTLSCIGKRVKLILNVPDYFKAIYDNWDFRGATVTYTKQSQQFWVRLIFEHPDPLKLEKGDVQDIDRGKKLYH